MHLLWAWTRTLIFHQDIYIYSVVDGVDIPQRFCTMNSNNPLAAFGALSPKEKHTLSQEEKSYLIV